MIALLLVLATSDLSGLTVRARPNPDHNLLSRNVLPDGTIGECRKVMEDRPGWLTVQCSTGPFLGQSVYHPMAAPRDIETARWVDPLQAARHGGAEAVLQKIRNDIGN